MAATAPSTTGGLLLFDGPGLVGPTLLFLWSACGGIRTDFRDGLADSSTNKK